MEPEPKHVIIRKVPRVPHRHPIVMEHPIVDLVVQHHAIRAIMWKIVRVSKMSQHRAMQANTFPTVHVIIAQIHTHIPMVERVIHRLAIGPVPRVMLIIPQT